MPTTNLQTATVIGFFSMPSPSLAETNPEAYNMAMSDLPAGAGSCAHCGTGIIHHVIVKSDGQTFFIGTTCAEKVGCERVRQSVRSRMTEEQLQAREQKAEIRRAADELLMQEVAAKRQARAEQFKDVLAALEAQQSDFHSSLASQLVDGPLSWKQADYAVKALLGRCTKKNNDAWEALYDQVQA